MPTQTEQQITKSTAAAKDQGSLSAYSNLRSQLKKHNQQKQGRLEQDLLEHNLLKSDQPAAKIFMRRFAAISIYDYIICLWVVTIAVVAVRTLFGTEGQRLTAHAPIQLYAFTVFLFRDSLFNGRGFGKGLLGLAVVDQKTKQGATLAQSLTRNLMFLWPYFLYQFIALVLPADLNHTPLANLMIFGFAYSVLLVVAESILMLRGEGIRLADRISGTLVIQPAKQSMTTSEQC
ncbi:hypothetical protein BH11CYA1_BH11CYA1_03260 [soil metagenome]